MGLFYSFKCQKCSKEYSVFLGAGMMYPHQYRDKLSEIATGKYGSSWQELYKNTPFVAINADNVIYVCSACNTWEEGTDITLYAPNDPESISQQRFGEKTVSEWGYVPYVMDSDLKADYHVLKRYYHCCRKCGKRMHKADNKGVANLP